MTKKEITYSEALAELEAILSRFNDQTLDIDSLAEHVKRATELIKICKGRLHKVEAEVNTILNNQESSTNGNN